jgi:NADH:ubiquinone reductase (H+-translocating)
MTKIVIAGAGFGGLNAALGLEKNFKGDKNISITLIDRHDYHLYSPSLYEVAASDEELAGMDRLKKSIALPLKEALAKKKINFLQGEVAFIDPAGKKIKAGLREADFDYLVLALGSRTEYFKIQGAENYGLPLKNLNDALRIRNALEFAVQMHKNDAVKRYIRFVVAGGGYSGVEFSGELAKLCGLLAWKNGYPREKIEVCLVEASNQLVPEFDRRQSADILNRLAGLGVRVKLLSPIFKVDRNFVELVGGERILYDVLVWTAGVRACDVSSQGLWEFGGRGQVMTDEYLRVKGQSHIFALGDAACVKALDGKMAPATAQVALAQAKYLSGALPLLLQNKKPTPFIFTPHPFIVSVGGKWAVFKGRRFYLSGFLPYLLRLGANFRYYASLVGWFNALRYVILQAELYGRND